MSIITEKQRQTLDKYVKLIHMQICHTMAGMRMYSEDERYVRENQTARLMARQWGQTLYDAPKLKSGLASVQLIFQKLNDFSVKPCAEHHHGRQNGGAELVSLMFKHYDQGTQPSEDEILQIALKFCEVHFTTPEENQALKQFQQDHDSETAYELAGIKLLHALELFTSRMSRSTVWRQEMIEKYMPIIQPHLMQ